MKPTLVAITGLCLLLCLPAQASSQTAANVLLVINEASHDSVAIGEYYAARRALPPDHVVRLTAPTTETLLRPEYDTTIEAPIAEWLWRHGLQDTILYIVLTKGVPIRITGIAGRDGTLASVDSELTLLYRKMVGETPPILGRVDNPYFLGSRPVGEARPFTRFDGDIYLVTRLDGFSTADVYALIERGLSARRDGSVVLDRRALGVDAGGDRWLLEAADRLEAVAGSERVALEDTTAPAAADGPVLGYYSWGSNDPAIMGRGTGLRFVDGAIGGMFVSTDGRTFTEPPADWEPGASTRPPGLFGSGSQSLAADLIREGITGVSAHVDEPYLDGTIRPQVLFPAYLSGFSLAEAFYLAMPYLSWQTLVIGDPLVAPFRDRVLPAEEISKAIDPETELPGLFADRRLASVETEGLDLRALRLLLRADARAARGDTAGAEEALRAVIELEPKIVRAPIQLAGDLEERGEFAEAERLYRRVLDVDPNQVIALNNLAYLLAVRLDDPQQAYRYAERASHLSSMAAVLDTFGWVLHLLGDHEEAARWVERAVTAAPDNAEFLLHAAAVHAELGELASARIELEAALKIDPTLSDRPDVRALRARIGDRRGPWE